MTAALDDRPPDPPAPDPLPDLALMQMALEAAARAGDCGGSEAELVDQIAALETLGHSVAALQAERIREFGRAHAASRVERDGEEVDPAKLEGSIAAQVGLACRCSPTLARRRLRLARVMHEGLDHVRELFAAGVLSRDGVDAVVSGTADLDASQRAQVDRELAARSLTGWGIGKLRDLVRKLAARVAPERFRARAQAAHASRRVTLRPGDDGMCWLTAHLPVEQGVACLAALHRSFRDLAVDPAPLTRTRGHVMADTLVERLTGRATADQIDVEVQVLVPVEALIDPESDPPAEVPGFGPVPLHRLLTGKAGLLTLRRLITRDGVVVGGDSRRRTFTGVLADVLKARDGHRCREPYCDAPVRHLDHLRRAADGGGTELDNGRCVCEFHNYVREQPGWRVENTAAGIRTTTPTGHRYLSPVQRVA